MPSVRIQERNNGKMAWMQIPKDSTLQDVHASTLCPSLLKGSLQGWMDWQRRTATRVEQALRAARLAPEFVAALYALGTQFVSPDLEKPVSLEEALSRKGELFNTDWKLEVPCDKSSRNSAFEKVSRTPADSPIVFAACSADFDGKKVGSMGLAVTGVQRGGASVLDSQSLVGSELTSEAVSDFLEKVQFSDNLLDSFQGSSEYRLEMIKVVLDRVLTACIGGEES